MQQRKITFVGAGNMAHAIIAGLVSGGYPANYITACSPTAKNHDQLVKKYGIHGTSDNYNASNDAEVIILAVKPQIMETICQSLKEQINFANKLILTIAAGIPAKRYQQYLDPNINLVRVMPNTPSLVGQGVSGLYAMDTVSADDKTFATELMANVGKAFWLTSEATKPLLMILLLLAVVCPLTFFYLWNQCNRRLNDLVLIVKQQQSWFYIPPKVLLPWLQANQNFLSQH